MITPRWNFYALGIGLIAIVAAIFLLQGSNAKLRVEAAALQQQEAAAALRREDNQRTQAHLALAQRDEQDSAQALHTELTRLREEEGQLEARASRVAEKKAADAAM